MKLFILDEVFELENRRESIEEVFNYISQALAETDYHFSYMIVDGKEVHDEFEIYLEGNINFISEIKVVMLTTREIVRDNLATIAEYIDRAIPIINNLSDEFYKEPDSEDWRQIGELTEGIGFIFHTLESVDSMDNLNEIVASYKLWNEYVKEAKELTGVIEELNQAMENTDTVLVGDLLSHEIIPIFEKMKEKLDALLALG